MIVNPEKYLVTAGGKITCLRCTAQSSRTKEQCKNPALKISKTHKCKWHGGMSTGPKTEEGVRRIKSAHWKHGKETKEAKHRRSLKFNELYKLEEIARKINLIPKGTPKTRGRKPKGHKIID